MNKKQYAWFVLVALLLSAFAAAIYCRAADNYDDNAVLAIIGEAERETFTGKVAVACGIRNRGNLDGIKGLTSKRVLKHKYSEDTEVTAISAWVVSENPKNCDFIHGATLWENINDFGWPADWDLRKVKLVATIGRHNFYIEKK